MKKLKGAIAVATCLTMWFSQTAFASGTGENYFYFGGGSWTIALTLSSTNGRSMNTDEYYEFSTGFVANDACRQTADAFLRAVQNLIGRTVKDPSFAALLK